MPGTANNVLRNVMLSLTLCAALHGCNRTYYRNKADHEVAVLIDEKSNDPRWAYDNFTIRMDPRSRYEEVNDRDFPPMPPDDPASHEFMMRVDGKRGYSGWDEYGYTQDLPNPFWKDQLASYCTITDDGSILLRLEDALKLARIHSPDYQSQLETLYLSALDVSTERFRFDTQFFGGVAIRHVENGDRLPSDRLNLDTNAQLTRRFASAGTLLADFANNTVWTLDNGTSTFTTSLLDFSIVQPLLRNGGRAIALETLTIVERTLLANLRAMQRWRKGFYTDVAIGDGGVGGPTRRGGFLGGTGLTGFTGTGGGGFGGVGQATGFGRGFGGGGGGGAGTAGAGTGLAGGGAGTVGGFIGLLQERQQIRNTEESLNSQLRTLALLEANLEAGLIDIAQVDQFRQSIETQRAQLLQAQNGLQSSMDNFKRSTLGLPPDLPIVLDESFIQPFQLIGPAVAEIQESIDLRLQQFGQLPRIPQPADILPAMNQAEEVREQIGQLLSGLPAELESLDAVTDQRTRGMTPAEERLFLADIEQLRERYNDLQDRFDGTANALQMLRNGLSDETAEQTADEYVSLMTQFKGFVGEASLIQARARLEKITVEPIELEPHAALEVARANRLDWMNARASLVDSWRLIEFNANRLKSDLTIQFDGNVNNVGNNPLDFQANNGTLRARLQWDPPFTRLNERNNFRQQLIEYQQARRGIIQFEDGIHQSLRNLLRNLEQLRVNLEIQRRAVVIAIRRVDQTTETLNQPVPPAPPGQLPAAFGPTAAQNLLSALEDLRNVQNNMMSVWLNYYASRMVLYRDLGIMELDETGAWIDRPLDYYINLSSTQPPEAQMPPPVPAEWMEPGAFGPETEEASEGAAEVEAGPRLGSANIRPGAGRATLSADPIQQADFDRSAALSHIHPGGQLIQSSREAPTDASPPKRTASGLGGALRQRVAP